MPVRKMASNARRSAWTVLRLLDRLSLPLRCVAVFTVLLLASSFCEGFANALTNNAGAWHRKRFRRRSPGSPRSSAAVSETQLLRSGFMPETVTREQLVAWAQEPDQHGLYPPYPVSMKSCSFVAEAQLYGSHLSKEDTVQAAYQEYVTKHQKWRKARHDAMERSTLYDRTGILVIQWNTELFFPSSWELLQSVIPTNGLKVDVNKVDGVFITLQENTRKSSTWYRRLLASLVLGLNALSEHQNWDATASSFVQLRNWLGTKKTAVGHRANTQSILYVGRSSVTPEDVHGCQWSRRRREKGFVAITAKFNTGPVLVVGTHLPTLKENQHGFLIEMFKKIIGTCIPKTRRHLGLDYFTGGVLVTGDLNARFSESGLRDALEAVENHPLYENLNAVHPEENQTAEMAKLFYMLEKSLPAKEVLYFPLLWASDSLGGAPVDKKENELRTPFSQYGFDLVNACYTSLVSYGWQKGCNRNQGEQEEGLFRRCLAPKSRRKPTGLGYLDRVLVRLPIPRAKMQPGFPGPADAFISLSGELQNFHGDHLPQIFFVEIFRQHTVAGLTTESISHDGAPAKDLRFERSTSLEGLDTLR